MNYFLILVAIPLVCAAIAIYLAARDGAKAGRPHAPRRVSANAKGFLLHSWAFLPLVSILFLTLAGGPASAQEIIHARAGQLIAANSTAKTLTLKVADGSTVVFKEVADPAPAMSFDKDVRSKTVAAGAFHTVGAYVVVFYFGFNTPTAVAVENLGSSALTRTTGRVASFDRHKHLLMLTTDTAKPQELAVSDDTIVDTAEGVIRPADFHPGKGEQLRCFAKPASQAALFLAPN